MRALAVALLLVPALAGCSGLGGVPEGCGEERRHRLYHDEFAPAAHAVVATEASEVVYTWSVPVTNACRNEHVAIDLRLETASDDSGCRGPTQVVGSAYRAGSLREIPMPGTGSVGDYVFQGSDSYGLKQQAGTGGVDYTVDIEAHFAADGHDADCGQLTLRSVEIIAVDRVAA